MTPRGAVLARRHRSESVGEPGKAKGRIGVWSGIVVIVLGSTSGSLKAKHCVKVEIENQLKKGNNKNDTEVDKRE